MKIKKKVTAKNKQLANRKWVDLKHFIELLNVDKEVVKKIVNLSSEEEIDKPVDEEVDLNRGIDLTAVDKSLLNNLNDSDSEREENENIFNSDDKEKEQRE
jgi:hypothetical protein